MKKEQQKENEPGDAPLINLFLFLDKQAFLLLNFVFFAVLLSLLAVSFGDLAFSRLYLWLGAVLVVSLQILCFQWKHEKVD